MPVQLILSRLVSLVPVLFLVSVGIFGLTFLIPGDAAVQLAGGENASPEKIEQVRQEFGLDRPVLNQYWDWISGVLTGDLGTSLYNHVPVTEELLRRFPATLSLTAGALTVTIILGFVGGVAAALRRGTWIDRVVQAGASLAIAMPSFWFALMLVLLFSVALAWLPAIGYVSLTETPVGWFRSLMLPSIALGLSGAAVVARQLRGSLIDTMQMDYIRTARARGLSPRRVVAKHALKNALIPVLTLLGVQLTYLLGGTVVIEQIFGIPGIGKYIFDSVFTLDLQVVQGAVLVIAVLVVLVNLLVDISYGIANPKLRRR